MVCAGNTEAETGVEGDTGAGAEGFAEGVESG